MTLTPKAESFMAKNPTLIGEVADYKFYEHPTKGDEAYLIAITPDGRKKITGHVEANDIPSLHDIENMGYDSENDILGL